MLLRKQADPWSSRSVGHRQPWRRARSSHGDPALRSEAGRIGSSHVGAPDPGVSVRRPADDTRRRPHVLRDAGAPAPRGVLDVSFLQQDGLVQPREAQAGMGDAFESLGGARVLSQRHAFGAANPRPSRPRGRTRRRAGSRCAVMAGRHLQGPVGPMAIRMGSSGSTCSNNGRPQH